MGQSPNELGVVVEEGDEAMAPVGCTGCLLGDEVGVVGTFVLCGVDPCPVGPVNQVAHHVSHFEGKPLVIDGFGVGRAGESLACKGVHGDIPKLFHGVSPENGKFY